MEQLELSHSSTPITEEQFDHFVQEFGLKLPESYKKFMLRHNGGVPNLSLFVDENYDEFPISVFSRISTRHENLDELLSDIGSIRDTIETHQIEEDNIPKHLYPFGTDLGGSMYCIDMNTQHILKFYWDGSDPRFVATTFLQFINGLEYDPTYDDL